VSLTFDFHGVSLDDVNLGINGVGVPACRSIVTMSCRSAADQVFGYNRATHSTVSEELG
jgi:hypothetical protein